MNSYCYLSNWVRPSGPTFVSIFFGGKFSSEEVLESLDEDELGSTSFGALF